IVRRASASVSFTPTHGTSYSQGYSSGGDEVVYKGTAATFDDTTVATDTFYYYKAFVYNADDAYSGSSNEASALYTTKNICGDSGNSCYNHSAAMTAGV